MGDEAYVVLPVDLDVPYPCHARIPSSARGERWGGGEREGCVCVEKTFRLAADSDIRALRRRRRRRRRRAISTSSVTALSRPMRAPSEKPAADRRAVAEASRPAGGDLQFLSRRPQEAAPWLRAGPNRRARESSSPSFDRR